MRNNELKNYRVSEWRRRQKQKAVDYLGGYCKNCGYSKCLDALEFHHRDPDKKEFRFSQYPNNWEKAKKELDKCDLLCANCHREVHAVWKSAKIKAQKERFKNQGRSSKVIVYCAFCSKLKKIWPSRRARSKNYFCNPTCFKNFRKTSTDDSRGKETEAN